MLFLLVVLVVLELLALFALASVLVLGFGFRFWKRSDVPSPPIRKKHEGSGSPRSLPLEEITEPDNSRKMDGRGRNETPAWKKKPA